MKVKLISMTKPVSDELVNLTAEELTAYVARVSNPTNQMNNETSAKLLGYCIKNSHWSVFEHINFTVEITTSRAIAAQILRHKSAFFQEFCMSGETEIYFDLPRTFRTGKKQLYKLKLKDLYRKWYGKDALGNSLKDRIEKMYVRSYDNETKLLTHSHIKEVFKTGIKPIFEIKLTNGRTIKCTKEHKVLTKDGFKSLEEAAGLNLVNDIAFISNKIEIGCNGIPIYQDKDWLASKKMESLNNKKGIEYIAESAGCSYHTIRKWLKIHDLRFTKKEIGQISDIWNRGKTGYKLGPWSEEARKACRERTPKGDKHHSYKGGIRSERMQIANFFNPFRKEIFKKFNFVCQMCSSPFGNNKIDLHHIKEVSLYPEFAKDIDNIIPVHRTCHMKYHGKTPLFKNKKKIGTNKTVNWVAIEYVKYLGEEETYDLEIDSLSHNYVADGIIVHNSQRYSEVSEVEIYQARRQDIKNRQNSVDDMSEEDKQWFIDAQQQVAGLSTLYYKEALKRNIAKEQARFLLPLSTQTTLYMTNNLRNWIHYIDLRTKNGTQLEHAEIANEIKEIFKKEFPNIALAKGY